MASESRSFFPITIALSGPVVLLGQHTSFLRCDLYCVVRLASKISKRQYQGVRNQNIGDRRPDLA
jgi:hypothetical protein